jgi:DNA-binding NarL/FixJ family response regulator
MLPDGSGLNFLSELRTLYETPSRPVCALFLTAKTERGDILAGLSAGGNDSITKPYDIDEFRMRVLGFLRLCETGKNDDEKTAPLSPVSKNLTERELAVAVLAVNGLRNKEIADKVFLSVSRVKTCLSGIYKKLGISKNNNKRELLYKILIQ